MKCPKFCYRVYEREDIEECQTLKSSVLIDEIEKDLHELQNYQETHSYISDAIPELKPFLESKVVPVTGDWPSWYFHKKMVCQHKPESLTLVPELGQLHIYLNGIEDVIKQYHPIFNEIYKAVFGQKKARSRKPQTRQNHTKLNDHFYRMPPSLQSNKKGIWRMQRC